MPCRRVDPPNLERQGIDVAIVLRPTAAARDDWECVFPEYIMPGCSPGLAATGPVGSLADLDRHTLIEFDDGHPGLDANWPVWSSLMGLPPLAPVRWLRMPTFGDIYRIAAMGQGMCLCRTPHANEFLRDQSLVAPFGKVLVSTRGHYLFRNAAIDDPRVDAFCDWFRSLAARENEFVRSFLLNHELCMPSIERQSRSSPG